MSTSPIYTTFCDAGAEPEYPPKQQERCRHWTAEADTRAESRKGAKANGWAVGAKGVPDLCPGCTPEWWCPTCGVSGDMECATSSGRNHRDRNLLMLSSRWGQA